MKKIFTLLLLLSSLMGMSQSTTIVISQVYGAGGNAGAVLNADYVELHNISNTPQSLNGMSIQYESAIPAGTWGSTIAVLPNVNIPAGGFYLVQLSIASATVGAPLPTPDFFANVGLGGSNGIVALLVGTTVISGCPTTNVVDLVGFGSATCYEGAGATPALSATLAGFRVNNGCTDTNNNGADFITGTPAPKNSASAPINCGAPVTPTLSATPKTSFGNVCLNTTAGPNSFTINGSNLTNANIAVSALAGFAYATTATGTYTPSLDIAQPGGTFTQVVYVQFTPTASQSYNGNISVSGGGVAAVQVAATGTGNNAAPPVTVTGSASSITLSGATLNGSISNNGCSPVTAYGIEYSTVNNFANGSGTQLPSTNIAGNSFSAPVAGLNPGTVYYFKAYATNSGGTAYGNQQSFSTIAAVLSATPLTAFGSLCVNNSAGPNSFAITSAALGTANVTVGPLTGYTFATSANGTYTSNLSITQPGGAFSQTVFVKFTPTALQSYNGNIAVAGGGANPINVAATGAGVNTPGTATTATATNITTSSATLAGTITGAGCSATTSYGIEYSGINNFVNGSGTKIAGSNAAPNGSFTVDATGLVLNTKYYYRTYVVSASGTGYGNLQSFTTDTIKNELVLYAIPAQRGTSLRFSVNNIKPNHYAVVLFNSNGQKVYRKDMIIQTTYVNDAILIPASIAPGVYQFQLENVNGYRKRKTILIK